MVNVQPLTKVAFKAMHKGGQLLLIEAAPVPIDRMIRAIDTRLTEGGALPDGRMTSPGSFGFIDDNEHKAYIDEGNGLVFMVNKYLYGGRPAFNTVLYRAEV